MPKPRKNEKESDFVSRCIPTVLKDKTAGDSKQAYAICKSMFSAHKEKKEINKLVEEE